MHTCANTATRSTGSSGPSIPARWILFTANSHARPSMTICSTTRTCCRIWPRATNAASPHGISSGGTSSTHAGQANESFREQPRVMSNITQFHLAFPVRDLDEARRFYGDVVGCPQGRSDTSYQDFDFFGHHLVAH